jgi:hypothetical protein
MKKRKTPPLPQICTPADDLVPDLPPDFENHPPLPDPQALLAEDTGETTVQIKDVDGGKRHKRPYRKVPPHPARKPRHLQWSNNVGGGSFRCGRCKKLYRSRLLLHQHKQNFCYNWLYMLDRDTYRRIKLPKYDRATLIRELLSLPKPKIGRPKNLFYVCKHCRAKFDTS